MSDVRDVKCEVQLSWLDTTFSLKVFENNSTPEDKNNLTVWAFNESNSLLLMEVKYWYRRFGPQINAGIATEEDKTLHFTTGGMWCQIWKYLNTSYNICMMYIGSVDEVLWNEKPREKAGTCRFTYLLYLVTSWKDSSQRWGSFWLV